LRNHFPKPTVSPTKDPHYVYREYSGPSKNRNNQNIGLSNEYIIKKELTATDPPTKIRNSFDEGRYEFRPSRFRQKEPILLSGSSLFGSSVSDPVKSSRQTGGSNYPQAVNLENILIRSKNISSDGNPSSLGEFSNPTSYEDYIKNLERFSGLPVLGNLANTDPASGSAPATGTSFQIRPPGPGSRPSSHFSEGYAPPPFPFAPPPPPPASPPDGSSSTSTSTSGEIFNFFCYLTFLHILIILHLFFTEVNLTKKYPEIIE
jgi:hypothetical protein